MTKEQTTAKKKIKEIDAELDILRDSWMNEKKPAKKKTAFRMIEEKLDSRLMQMTIRDAKPSSK